MAAAQQYLKNTETSTAWTTQKTRIKKVSPGPKASQKDWRLAFSSHSRDFNFSVKLDAHTTLGHVISALGFSVPQAWQKALQSYIFGLTYTSTNHRLYLNIEDGLLTNVKRRMRFILPSFSFQIQTSSLPLSLTAYPIVPCRSEIFDLCVEGNISTVKLLFEKSLASPFAVNQHGENLLHASELPSREVNVLTNLGCSKIRSC